MAEAFIEVINDNIDGQILCYVSRQLGETPDRTKFVTQDEHNPQIGFIVYPKGHEIKPHYHNPVERKVYGTPETLIVRRGRMTAHIFNKKLELVKDVVLNVGDVCILVGGGHGFTMEEDTVLLEIKQGPYAGTQDKVYFEKNAAL